MEAVLARDDDELRSRAARILAFPEAFSTKASRPEQVSRYHKEVAALLSR
jgi:hypothetical protein